MGADRPLLIISVHGLIKGALPVPFKAPAQKVAPNASLNAQLLEALKEPMPGGNLFADPRKIFAHWRVYKSLDDICTASQLIPDVASAVEA